MSIYSIKKKHMLALKVQSVMRMHAQTIFSTKKWAAIIVVTLLGMPATASAAGVDARPSRSFRLGFCTTPYDNLDKRYALIKSHGDVVSHSLVDGVPWPEALRSSNYKNYSKGLQNWWEMLRNKDSRYVPSHNKYIVVSPVETTVFKTLAPYWGGRGGMPLPSPWGSYEFNHPNVKKAYVNYLMAVVGFFKPKYIAINMEANILLAQAPLRWNAFKELNAYAYTALKKKFPKLVVFSSIQYEHMQGGSWSGVLAEKLKNEYPNVLANEVRLLLRHSDLMALSTFPYMVYGNVVHKKYYEPAITMAKELDMPVAIDQTGYISKSFAYRSLFTLQGSEKLQNDFLGFLLYQAWLRKFEFVVNFVAIDYAPFQNIDDNTWSTTGLVGLDGRAKPALATWDRFFKMPLHGRSP